MKSFKNLTIKMSKCTILFVCLNIGWKVAAF